METGSGPSRSGSDPSIDVLERWELCGGTWSVRSLTATGAKVELRTCDGVPVDTLCSADPVFLVWLRGRLGSGAG